MARIIRCLFIIYILILSSIVVFADNVSKEDKKLLKKLKKEYNLKKKPIFIEKFGLRYLRLLRKDGTILIADSLGEIIIPDNEQIEYTSIDCVESLKNGCIFIAYNYRKNETTLYSKLGKRIKTFKGRLRRIQSYYKLSNNIKSGLITSDGEEILPIEYDLIYEYLNNIYIRKNNYEGAITNDSIIGIIPCIFNDVKYNATDKLWYVKIHKFDEYVVYNHQETYDFTFRDEGEQLLEQGKYLEIIDLYQNKFDSIPHSRVYVAISEYELANSSFEALKAKLDVRGTREITLEEEYNIKKGVQHLLSRLNNAELQIDEYERLNEKDFEKIAINYRNHIKELKAISQDLYSNITEIVRDNNNRFIENERQRISDDINKAEIERLKLERIKLENERINLRNKEQHLKYLNGKKSSDKHRDVKRESTTTNLKQRNRTNTSKEKIKGKWDSDRNTYNSRIREDDKRTRK